MMEQTIELCGGRKVVVYGNIYCGICGELMHEEIICRKMGANVCGKHCSRCREYIACVQRCGYGRLQKKSTAKKPVHAKPAFKKPP